MSLLNFWKKKPSKEEKLQAFKDETYKDVDKASEKLRKIKEDFDSGDITLQIYYATRRKKGK